MTTLDFDGESAAQKRSDRPSQSQRSVRKHKPEVERAVVKKLYRTGTGALVAPTGEAFAPAPSPFVWGVNAQGDVTLRCVNNPCGRALVLGSLANVLADYDHTENPCVAQALSVGDVYWSNFGHEPNRIHSVDAECIALRDSANERVLALVAERTHLRRIAPPQWRATPARAALHWAFGPGWTLATDGVVVLFALSHVREDVVLVGLESLTFAPERNAFGPRTSSDKAKGKKREDAEARAKALDEL